MLRPYDPAFYRGLFDELALARTGLVKTFLVSGEEDLVRTLPEAQKVLETLESIHREVAGLVNAYPTLDSVFEQEYGPFQETFEREALIEASFLDDFIFPGKEKCALYVDGQFAPALVDSYKEFFTHWVQEKKENHIKTQDVLKNHFTPTVTQQEIPCQCHGCGGDYRTKLREFVFADCEKVIIEMQEWLTSHIEEADIDQIGNRVFEAQKILDKKMHQVRFKLRRASASKLEGQVKDLLKVKLSFQGEVGRVYSQKLEAFFGQKLREQGLRKDLVSTDEFERFYRQMGMNMWKGSRVIMREFDRLVKSVLSLKRKDISANILREYLGQFWLHSKARMMNRKIIYHMGPTNSGKTYYAIEALSKAKKGCYLAPLRLLAGELYDTLNSRGVLTTLLTGEEVIEVPGSTHTSSTIEMAKLQEIFDCAVIDEIQMISDSQRGWAWTRGLINIQADEVHVCGDHSVLDLIKQIVKLTGDSLEVKTYQRLTELKLMEQSIGLGSLQKGDALIVFSRRNALKYKADLEDLGFKVSIVYGRLSPEVRREQARKFDEEETDIIVSTDAISMGMNLPIKRIVFSTLSKFIDEKEYQVSNSEIKQIAGRAGRFKRHPIGFVTCLSREDGGVGKIRQAIEADLPQQSRVMVGPDLEIFNQVNKALEQNSLPILKLSEFLRLFNTMIFEKPFYCVDLREMIELAEMVEQADNEMRLTSGEIFGFACAPVNLGLIEHVQYYIYILNNYTHGKGTKNEEIDSSSDNIDYLETSIKCVELYQWLARHFSNRNFDFKETELLHNKALAVERLNGLLSEKIVRECSSCGAKLDAQNKFSICERCFQERRFRRRPPPRSGGGGGGHHSGSGGGGGGGNRRRDDGPRRGTAKAPRRRRRH